jgi:hypothetical protein
MSVIRFSNKQEISFDPETISIIAAAFEKACDALGLSDRRDALTELLARKVIEAAQAGERDPLRIYQMAMDKSVFGAIPGVWSEAETMPSRAMALCGISRVSDSAGYLERSFR